MAHAIATYFNVSLIRNMEYPYLLQPKDQHSRVRPELAAGEDTTFCFGLREYRVPRIKTRGRFDDICLSDDMRILLSKAGNTILEAATSRKAASSTPWVRIRRTSWENTEVSPGPIVVYEMRVAQLDRIFERQIAPSVDIICELIYRKTDEAWTHVERKISQAGVGARDTWREGWMRAESAASEPHAQSTAPVVSRKKPRTLPF